MHDGLFLEYSVEGSTGPDTTRVSTERFTFRLQADGRFVVDFEGEQVSGELFAAAYGDPILVDASLVTARGVALQFHGLCPFLLTPSQWRPNAEVSWIWDGAGVRDVPIEPEDQIVVQAMVTGPIRWHKWSAWVLEQKGLPPNVSSPRAYYDEGNGLLVGLEHGADVAGARFIICDAELTASR